MRVQPNEHGALQALQSVLLSIDSVRNARAWYLLLLGFTAAGLLITGVMQALGRDADVTAALLAGAAFFCLFYSSNAAGLVLMDEACGREIRFPREALGDALRCAHRLLAVVICVLAASAALGALVTALLWACRLPVVGTALLGVLVPLAVPALGLAVVALLALVGPVAAPAVWDGLGVRAVLALLIRQARVRFAQALMLSAAVSLISALVAGLVSFVVLAGGRALLGLAYWGAGIELAGQPFLAALFGQSLRVAPGAPALSALNQAAHTGAGVVFALGLVVPAVVYLRGLCELYLALRRSDGHDPADPARTSRLAGTPP